MQNRKELLSYIDTLGLILVGLVFLLFPIVFTSLTSDLFNLPKQILIGVGVLLSLTFFGIRTLVDGKLTLRATPFDIPLFLFGLVLFLSAFLSVNKVDSLISFIPILFAILLYFVVVNVVRNKKGILVLSGALLLGTAIASFMTILAFFKIYLPMTYAQIPHFTPLGSLLDQAIVFGIMIPLAAYLAHPMFSAVLLHGKAENSAAKKLQTEHLLFGLSGVIIAIGLVVTLYQLMTTQIPIILPFWEGFRTGLAAISRDTSRALASFLFGSGYGTYLTDFTRFKEASYNTDPKLWSFSFFRSSTFFFELLATTGALGVASYIFIAYRVMKERWLFLPLVLILVASIFLPFSYLIQALFFMLLGIFALARSVQNPKKYPETELSLVALRQGLFSVNAEAQEHRIRHSIILPAIFCILLAAVVGSLGYFATRFVLSDITFQRSLMAAQVNNGGATYELQRDAIAIFPYRDAYYRVFAQTNLALANNLAAAQPKGASPSAETQQTILTLIQQSINSGRSAVTMSPLTVMNWNNLSAIYRSLIGFGQNADQFSILTNRQAIALDPNNPQQYINLGGIYYQLGQWEEAQQNFQLAASLKPDYANAYYNLGHALESKGDLQNALAVYKQVKQLTATDPNSVKLISEEIAALEKKIAQQGNTVPAQSTPDTEAAAENPLGTNGTPSQLPERNPKVEIPGITVSPTPKVSTTPTPSGAAPTASVSVTVSPTPAN